MKVLVYGGNGWIGQLVINKFKRNNIEFILGIERVDCHNSYVNEIKDSKATHVLSFIGRTHGPDKASIDYLESKDKLYENILDNLYGPIMLARTCEYLNVHFTYIGTGCIYQGYDTNTTKEDSLPNFFGSSYSVVKGFTDLLIKQRRVLNLRIRLPIDIEEHPRNLITKLVNYEKISSVPNSVTVLPTIIPILIDMLKTKTIGTYNMTNPGMISNNEILELYKKYVDPGHIWENCTVDEQSRMLDNQRSNTHLNTDKIESVFDIMNVYEAVENCMINYKKILP